MTLDQEDLEVCPNCGERESAWLQEVGTRASWQPFTLVINDQGDLEAGDWHEWEVADDVIVEHWECRTCLQSWASFESLHTALLAAKRARADSELLETMLGDAPRNALAVFLTNPMVRGMAEQIDPMAVEQARKALGLDPDQAKEASE